MLPENSPPCSFSLDLPNFLTSPAVFRDGRKVWADAADQGRDDLWRLVLGEGFWGTQALNRFSLGRDISSHRHADAHTYSLFRPNDFQKASSSAGPVVMEAKTFFISPK